MAGQLERGAIHLCQLKDPDKRRPALLLTRSALIGRLSMVTVLDESDGMKNPSVANLLNLVTIPERSIGPRVGKLSPAKLEEACSAMRFALGCD